MNKVDKFLAQIVENSSNEFYIIDQQSLKLIYANPMATGNNGYRLEDLLGMKLVELIPDLKEEILREIAARLTDPTLPETREIFEAHEFRQDGSKYPVRIRLQLGNLQEQDVFVAIVQDYSAISQTEALLRKSLSIYKSLVNNSPYSIYQIDPPGNLTSINKAGLDMIGVSEETKFIGTPFLRFISSEDKERVSTLLAAAFKGKHAEFESAGLNNTYFSSNLVPIFDIGNKIGGVLGISVDITERKLSEKKHLQNESMLIETGQQAKVGGWQYDLESKKSTWTRQAFAIFEIPPVDPAPLAEAYQFYHPEDRPKLEAAATKMTEQFEPYDLELRAITAAGIEKWVHCTGRAVLVNGKPTKYSGTMQDITERKKAEQQLQKIEKLEGIGLLAGGIAHDFNNILTTLFGNIALLKHATEHDSEAHELAAKSEKALDRAKHLTTQLLTFAKGGDPVKDRTNIVGLIQEVVAFDLTGSNVLAEYDIAPDLSLTEVDIGQMQQVFSNLTLNSLQSMPSGGHIYISAENSTEQLLSQGEFIKIVFADEGIGMSSEDQQKIFNPYFTTKETGQGLGLATTHSIINKHGGQISASSRLGEGTTITIYLPVSRGGKAESNTSPVADAAIQRAPGKILVMDDDAMVADVTSQILATQGHKVETVATGEQAIASYQKSMEEGEPYDCIIMDLTIPGGMGGKEAIAKLLALDPNAKAIVSSGYAKDSVMAEFKNYGFKGVVAKPFSIDELNQAVDRIINELP